jgi:hypothetical protein
MKNEVIYDISLKCKISRSINKFKLNLKKKEKKVTHGGFELMSSIFHGQN